MGGNTVAENLAETFSIDELGFESADEGNNTSLYIGKYLSPRLYAKYGVGLLEPTNTFFLRYRLNKHWSIESETGTTSNSGDIIYTLER
jgi:translocation and assembly module TamB